MIYTREGEVVSMLLFLAMSFGVSKFATYNRLLSLSPHPRGDLLGGQVDQAIVHLSTLGNDNHVGDTLWPRRCCGVLEPCRHLGLARLVEGNNIEEEVIAMLLLDHRDRHLDLRRRERVERVREVGVDGAHCVCGCCVWKKEREEKGVSQDCSRKEQEEDGVLRRALYCDDDQAFFFLEGIQRDDPSYILSPRPSICPSRPAL